MFISSIAGSTIKTPLESLVVGSFLTNEFPGRNLSENFWSILDIHT